MANWKMYVTEEENDVAKSKSDQISYRVLKLTNGMKICLMSFPRAIMASAAMDVHVGSMSDPDDIPGLAHLCEHLLFMGSEKYPAENDLHTHITKHGGNYNAVTEAENTNYHFHIKSRYLSGALDRFAHCFISPLFAESTIEKEVNAVHAENTQHGTNYNDRIARVERETMNPDHPYCRFHTGNRETLLNNPLDRGQNIQTELLKFHEKYYSSNIMSLAVFGRESLDELAEMIVPLFSQVENKHIPVPICKENPIRDEDTQMQINIVPNVNMKLLILTWPFEEDVSRPSRYVNHLINICGPGSLSFLLKAKGWVNWMSGDESGTTGFNFFAISMSLTETGMRHTDEIITSVFQYINMLREKGARKWIWDECAKMGYISFSYKETGTALNLTKHLAHELHKLSHYPAISAKEVLTNSYLWTEFQPCHIYSLLQQMKPNKLRVVVAAKQFKGQTDRVEKWYGTPYSVHKIAEGTLRKWECAGMNECFNLPTSNEFFPSNLELQTVCRGSFSQSRLIKETAYNSLWYKQSKKLLPKSCTILCISGHRNKVDPFIIDHCLHMFVYLLTDQCEDQFHSAKLAGLDCGIEYNMELKVITLSIEGFSDKQKLLLERLMQKLATFSANREQFLAIRKCYKGYMASFKYKQPYKQAEDYADELLAGKGRGDMDAVNDISIRSFTESIAQFFSSIHTDMLVVGNMSEEQAMELSDVAERCMQTIATTPLNIDETTLKQVQLPAGCKLLYQHQHDVNSMSALLVYYQCSTVDIHEKMLLHLFCKLIEEPCLNILRTKQQLGYSVYCKVREESSGVSGLSIVIQSHKHPQYLKEKVDEFLHDMRSFIEDMPYTEFLDHVTALASIRKYNQKNDVLDWKEIVNGQYRLPGFGRRKTMESEHVKTLTKDQICDFYNRCIASNSPLQRKLSIYVISKDKTASDVKRKPDFNEMFDLNYLKLILESYQLSHFTSKPHRSTGSPVPPRCPSA